MEATTFPSTHILPKPMTQAAPENWDWVYDDPDLAQFRTSTYQARKETPLTYWT